MFYFFYKIIIFIVNKEKDDNYMYEVRTVNSHNSETVNHIAHAIFMLHSAIKTPH